MLSNLHLLRYNNYYNRQLKLLNKLSDYEIFTLGILTNINFNPNDGVYTKQVINWNSDIPDYMIVEQDGDIISRWFVIESKRNLAGQFELELFRDTLADYYNEIQNAPIFVEKAILQADNPLIFNEEDITFNQIRQKPTLLYDKTTCPWIVGYIPRNAEFDEPITSTYNTEGVYDITVPVISDWEYHKYIYENGFSNLKKSTVFRYYIEAQSLASEEIKEIRNIKQINNGADGQEYIYSDYYITSQENNPDADFIGTYFYNIPREEQVQFSEQMSAVNTKLLNDSTYQSYINGYVNSNYDVLNEVKLNEIMNLDNKVIRDEESGEIYRIKVEFNTFEDYNSLLNETAITSRIKTHIPTPTGGNITNKTFELLVKGDSIKLTITNVQEEVKVTIGNDRMHLEDELFDMFCIPYGTILVFEGENGFYTKNIGTSLAARIAEIAGVNSVYDVQILPYCPVQYALDDDYRYLDLTKTKYSIITDNNDKKISALIWCRRSNFSFNINYNIPQIYNPIDKKIESQTTKYRLVSPNYASIFEFNPYKNNGLDYFRIDCSYKPYNPYIRIAPLFKGLYGYGGENDSRGLILSGDFSITQLSNAWANYELQNKNYQAMFDRQIQNMEVHNKYQRVNDWVNAIAGTVQGGVTGAMTGGMMGGGQPSGFAIGGAIGTAASAAGGAADIYINERLRNEAIDYTKDQFGYQLGNIQAIPSSLTKTTAITINNPLIPMIEFYTCTEIEKQAFRNKIEYNGMTVMVIGTMNQFSKGYFKGKLIRLENMPDDYHIVKTIANELNKGVFI